MTEILFEGIEYTVEEFIELNLQKKHPSIQNAKEVMRSFLNGVTSYNLKTSGSTGIPKTVSFNLDAIKGSSQRTLEALGIDTAKTVFWVALDTSFTGGFMMLMRGLVNKSRILLSAPDEKSVFNTQILEPFWVAFTPLQWKYFRARPDFDDHSDFLKVVLLGGQALPINLEGSFLTLPYQVYQSYGMTETLSNIALRALNGPLASDWFKPYNGVQLSVGESGCLQITDPVSAPEGFITQDLVEFNSEGGFKVSGRLDSVINTGGIKVIAEEIEQIARTVFTDRNLTVLGMPHPELGECVTLVFEGSLPAAASFEQKLLKLKEACKPYQAPKRVMNIDKIPLTETGKPQRKLLLASLLSINRLA